MDENQFDREIADLADILARREITSLDQAFWMERWIIAMARCRLFHNELGALRLELLKNMQQSVFKPTGAHLLVAAA